jgi:hypothetical protein
LALCAVVFGLSLAVAVAALTPANPPAGSPDAKPGSSPAPSVNGYTNQVSITVSGDFRIVYSNGIPNHAIGAFPNAHNPNTIYPQQNYFRIPLHPVVAKQVTPFGLGRFGVALNGVPIEAAGAEYWNGDPASGWQYEVMGGKINLGLDDNNAHVQPSGSYHYHGLPTALIASLGGGSTPKMILVGYAGDGFPIYNQYGHTDPKDPKSPLKKLKPSFATKKGSRPANAPVGPYDGTFTADYQYNANSGDLDECNGRFEVTPEYPDGIYHYTISESFPYIPRSFRGTPDATFAMPGPPGGGFGPPPGMRGPPRGGPPPYGPPPPRGGPPPPPFGG